MAQEPKQYRAAQAGRLMGGMLGLLVLVPAAAAQTSGVRQVSPVSYACYVPGSGTVYRIRAARTPGSCTDAGHIEFSLGSGVNELSATGGKPAADHGSLGGLLDDDHLQYLLANGVRTSTGFAVNAPQGTVMSIPATGAGVRLMWYPGKSAFRAGTVFGDTWDEAGIGAESFAAGLNPRASGRASVAFGRNTIAGGDYAVAFGYVAQAQGEGSFSAGLETVVTGDHAIGMGTRVWTSGHAAVGLGYDILADGAGAVALGTYARSNGKTGSFVFGDRSVNYHATPAADNQFMVRAQTIWLGTHSIATAIAGRFLETSTGAYLSTGGAWTNSSDSTRKTGFEAVDGETILAKLATMPVQRWSYRDEAASIRHLGPTAQDFRAAFGLGQGETDIATVDADGVALAAAKALVDRTATLARRLEAVTALAERQQDEIRTLRALMEELMKK